MILVLAFAMGAADIGTKAPAPLPPLNFGQTSDLVWTTGTAMRFSATAPLVSTPSTTTNGVDTGGNFSGEAILSLAVDYFFAKNLSVGGFATANYAWSNATYGPGFGVGPRIGYNLAFSEWASVWPRLDLSFGANSTNVRNPAMVPGLVSGMLWYFNAQLNLPLVFTLFQHVLLGIGPFFAFQPQWRAGTGNMEAVAFNFGLTTFVGLHY